MNINNERIDPQKDPFYGISPEMLKKLGVDNQTDEDINKKVMQAIHSTPLDKLETIDIQCAKQIIQRRHANKSETIFYKLFSWVTGSETKYDNRIKALDTLYQQKLNQLSLKSENEQVLSNKSKLELGLKQKLGNSYQGETYIADSMDKFKDQLGIHHCLIQDKANRGKLTYLKIEVKEKGQPKAAIAEPLRNKPASYMDNDTNVSNVITEFNAMKSKHS